MGSKPHLAVSQAHADDAECVLLRESADLSAVHHTDMLQGLQLAGQASDTAGASGIRPCRSLQTYRCYASVARPLSQSRRRSARSNTKIARTRCSIASVTAHSVAEVVKRATLEKPLFQQALHSIFTSLACFLLAWVVTRYVGRKAKECESPEASSNYNVYNVVSLAAYVKFYGRCRRQHFCQSCRHRCRASSALCMSMLARHCLWHCMCLLQFFFRYQRWCTPSAPQLGSWERHWRLRQGGRAFQNH